MKGGPGVLLEKKSSVKILNKIVCEFFVRRNMLKTYDNLLIYVLVVMAL
jgi:hypothetical protein